MFTIDDNTIFTILNLIFMWLFWKWMEEAEENKQPGLAFMYLFFSAYNAASIGLRYL